MGQNKTASKNLLKISILVSDGHILSNMDDIMNIIEEKRKYQETRNAKRW